MVLKGFAIEYESVKNCWIEFNSNLVSVVKNLAQSKLV